MNVRNCAVKRTSIFRRFHRDKQGNLLVIGAIFVMVLVIVLTVVINLAHITHEKIQAQNAADAAALTAGVWQVRGLSFIQNLNNMVYISDMLASFGLNVGVAGSAATVTVVGAPFGQPIGNAGLLVCMGAHGFSQFILVPLRDGMNKAWPIISALGGSEMAKRNQARPIIASVSDLVAGLASEAGMRWTGLNIGEKTDDWNPLNKVDDWLWGIIEKLPVYSLGLELNLPPSEVIKKAGTSGASGSTVSASIKDMLDTFKGSCSLAELHLDRVTGDWKGWPLVLPDAAVNIQLHFCAALTMCGLAENYFDAASKMQDFLDKKFNPVGQAKETPAAETSSEESGLLEGSIQDTVSRAADKAKEYATEYALGVIEDLVGTGCTKWRHPYYTSSEEVRKGEEKEMITLPPSTWVAGGGVDDNVYASRTALWGNMLGGLGVPKGSGTYGQLGSLACASIQVRADSVEKNPKTIRGWVNLVPVHVCEGEDDSRKVGICH